MEGLRIEREGKEKLLDIVHAMETIADSDLEPKVIQERSKELVSELLIHLEQDFHIHLSEDVSAAYGEMQRENLLARVESVARVIECLVEEKPIHVGHDEKHYANSVTSDIEGLRIAMAEADTIEPVRLMVGLDLKALVGFSSDHLSVSQIDDSEYDLRDTGLRKSFCRHVSGDIMPSDIKHMVMRIPRAQFPEGSLSESEKTRQTSYIFRVASLKQAVQGVEAPDGTSLQKAA